jgi:hypothetical protein
MVSEGRPCCFKMSLKMAPSPPPPASILAIIGKKSTCQIERGKEVGYLFSLTRIWRGGGEEGGTNTNDSKRHGFLNFDN